jgi:KaiC/GvpD/RAD55 family RecA-like ATPase
MDLSDYENRGKLIFIDCYSSLSGAASKEKRSIGSITDLTSLGIQITQATEEIAGATDVYFDSLTPLFTVLKTDYVLNFLQSVGAKVKSYNGGLCTTIGLTIEKDALTKVEEVADCVIETQLSEGRKGQKRRLRVKKLRGHPYDDSWTGFTITDQGIIFLAHKPQNHDKENHSSK